MTFKLKTSIATLALASAVASPMANAGGTITFGEDKSISVGFGFISNFTTTEDAAPDGDWSNDFSLGHARLYLSGSMNKYIKGMLNTEKSGGGDGGNWEVIDANVQLQFTPNLALWVGRFLSPSDRANMAGPFYSMGGGYWANIASRYGWNGGIIGRDDGVALVGNAMGGKVGYSFGAFEGDNIFRFSGLANNVSNNPGSGSDADDALMYAGRLQIDFWDPEPGYYGTGNYFGAKDILAIGLAGRQKSDGAVSQTGTVFAVGDYSSYSVDFLMEKKNVGAGTLSVEAAYYDYDTDDVFLSEQGDAYSAALAYLFNAKVGWGQFMPFVRYQEFDADSDVKIEKIEVGTNYIIAPYNALLTAGYSTTETTGASDVDAFMVTMQFQF